MEGGSEEEKERIKETVMEILKSSNMDETTEFTVRKTASDNLGLDLSTPHRKQIVRHVVESYLKQQQQQQDDDEEKDDDEKDEEKDEDEEKDDDRKKKKKRVAPKEFDDHGDVIVCKLSDKRRVTIQDFRGKTLVSLREYYKKDGKELPTAKGISLTAEQWSSFKKNVPAIEKAIKKMESRLN